MRIFGFGNLSEAKRLMLDIGVDPYGIKIMLPKTACLLVRLDNIPCAASNIMKQEMLSIGGDVAVSRGSLSGKTKNGPCLIIGRIDQFDSFIRKLKLQPFGLNKLAEDLDKAVAGYRKDVPAIHLRTRIMGVINLTPDSFSGDGLCVGNDLDYPSRALEKAEGMLKDGADIIDLGGESSRPGSRGVGIKEELRRVLPALKKIVKHLKIPVSVDTTKPEVAKVCLEAGAQIINDISGLRDRRMANTIAKHDAAVIIMHMRGKPLDMQRKTAYKSLIEDIAGFLKNAVDSAEAAGVDAGKIIVDPGIGFAKTTAQNLQIINRLQDFSTLGKPILVGPCRKSFIGEVLGAAPGQRRIGTATACLMAAERGASIVRVHDVKEVKQALDMFYAIRSSANA